jgi:hypothetical protein
MEDEDLGALSSVRDAEDAAAPALTGNPQALAVLNSLREEQRKRWDEYAQSIRAARSAQMQQTGPSATDRLASALLAAGRPNRGGSNWESLRQGLENWNQSGEAARQAQMQQKQLAAQEEAELAKMAFEQGSSLENLAAKYAMAPQKPTRLVANPVTGAMQDPYTGAIVAPGASAAEAGVVEMRDPTTGRPAPYLKTPGPQGRPTYEPLKTAPLTPEEEADRAAGIEIKKRDAILRSDATKLLPDAISAANRDLTNIDNLLKHPGLPAVVGVPDPFKGGFGVFEAPGSPAADAASRIAQLKSGAFLTGYQSLKGGGAITEIEGKKAEDAIVRAQKAQSEGEFRAAMLEYRNAIIAGVEKLKRAAGGQFMPGSSSAPVASSAAPSAASAQGGAKPLPANLLEQYRRVPATNRATAMERLRAAGYDISGLN